MQEPQWHSGPVHFDKSDLKWSKEVASLIKDGISFHNGQSFLPRIDSLWWVFNMLYHSAGAKSVLFVFWRASHGLVVRMLHCWYDILIGVHYLNTLRSHPKVRNVHVIARSRTGDILIIWTNDGLVYWRMLSIGIEELFNQEFVQAWIIGNNVIEYGHCSIMKPCVLSYFYHNETITAIRNWKFKYQRI